LQENLQTEAVSIQFDLVWARTCLVSLRKFCKRMAVSAGRTKVH